MALVIDPKMGIVPTLPPWKDPANPFKDLNDWTTYLAHVREMMPVREGGRQVGEDGYPLSWADPRGLVDVVQDWWEAIVTWAVPVTKAVGAVSWLLVKNPVVRNYVLNKAFWMAWPMIKFFAERRIYTKAARVAEPLMKQFFVNRGELATMKATAGQFMKAGSDLQKLRQIAPERAFKMFNKAIEIVRDKFREEFDEWRDRTEQEATSMAWFTRRRRGYSNGYNGGGYGGYRRGFRRGYNRYQPRYGGYRRQGGYQQRSYGYRGRYTPRRRWY